MKSKNKTRSALFTSIISLLLCISMLVGTTFAWFTDEVVSGNNVITAGNLDVELYWATDCATWTKVDTNTNIFDEGYWEPGHTEVVYLKAANEGTLALKYQLGINIVSETGSINKDGDPFMLSQHIQYGIVEDVTAKYGSREDAIKDVSNPTKLEAAYSSDEISLAPKGQTGDSKIVALVVYMPTTVDNEANHAASANVPTIKLGINLVATQQTAEADSFGTNYDAEAAYPVIATDHIPEGTASATAIEAGEVTVYIPAGAAAGFYELRVDNKTVTTVDDTTTVSYNISLYKDGVKVSGVAYPVEIAVGPMLDIVSLTHNGTAIADYAYDAIRGIVSFETSDFSPFAVTYKAIPASDVETNENGQIVAGVFEGINPATLDETLDDADSEYIAVSYEADGQTCYTVSKRTTTVVLAADAAADYTPENDNYTVLANQSGKLWSTIRDLQNNEHTTVYLLPGTYNEATTINVYSSMDIIGLGDKEDIKIVKVSSSNSNRHLFNCNGTKAHYIEVTIQNMSLDATANTTGGKDNAAVQCIRKTKVKCYDLNIIKGTTGWGAIAFYVNGNNAVDGVEYPAYMYAENCTLNAKNTFSILTTSGTYKFYHSGLTYNNGTAYTNNSTDIKNQIMAADDWDWVN